MMNMEQKKHLVKLGVPFDKIEAYLSAMDKYPYPWWTSQDPKILVRFQMNEPVLLIPADLLQYCLRSVLKRKVSVDEISFQNLKLKNEVFEGLERACREDFDAKREIATSLEALA